MWDRIIFLAAAIVTATISAPPPAHADPACPPSGCPHGRAHSPSYQDGYRSEHDYFSTPQNHSFLASELKQGYSIDSACQVELGGGAPPANAADWVAGCADALHDLGFKP